MTTTTMKIDFQNPNRRMLMRDGEEPISAVIAYSPDCQEPVITAIEQILATLEFHMEEDQVNIMETYAIRLHSGPEFELDEMSLFFSLSYPTAPGRTFEMQFGAPPSATLH